MILELIYCYHTAPFWILILSSFVATTPLCFCAISVSIHITDESAQEEQDTDQALAPTSGIILQTLTRVYYEVFVFKCILNLFQI